MDGSANGPKATAAGLLGKAWYARYVLAVLVVTYAINVMDRGVLSMLIEPIKREFALSDSELGFLSGIAFAFFYSTLGVPIAALADRTSRRNVLSLCALAWSGMTALCGLAINFPMLLAARIGTAAGEAGGSPPSHSLIADYFPVQTRATALSIYALGVPLGAMVGSFGAGLGNDYLGWRTTFVLAGLPGIAAALLVRFTVGEPPRGFSDNAPRKIANGAAPPLRGVARLLWRRTSFRHLSFAAALHSVVWYCGSSWNGAFFMRSHAMSSSEAGFWLALFAGIGASGTLLGGWLSDKLSARTKDRRWYVWVPGAATLIMTPFQFFSYLSGTLWVVIVAFAAMTALASFFFGPSFAMTQALVTLRMRAVAASILLFVQTIIGLGLGPLIAGWLSDLLAPTAGSNSLRYAITIVGLVNLWAAVHYFLAARTLRADLDETEALRRNAG